MGEPSGGKRRSRDRNGRNERNGGGDYRAPPRERSRSRSRNNQGKGLPGRDRENRGFDSGADRRREDPYRRGPPRGRSRSRERRDYRDYSRRNDDRFEDRGYGRGPSREDDYRRPMRREEEAMERGYRRPSSNGHDDRMSRRMANDQSSVVALPELEPTMMSPTGTVGEDESNPAATKAADKNKQPTREPKLLFAVAKNVVRVTSMKKPTTGTITSPANATGEGSGSVRMMFGKFRRSEASKLDLQGSEQGSQPVEQQLQALGDQSSKQQPVNKATKEAQPEPTLSIASADTEDRAHSESQATAGCGLVDNVRETLEQLVVQLDSVDPRKLLAVRLGGELRGLLGKAQDEFAAYEAEFVEHVFNEGVSVSLKNFSASLTQVSAIAERLRTAKFLLNRTFKREVLFAFQEINSYYTSLFMELSMAVARRSGIELPLPAPVAPPPEPIELPAPSGDEICLEAHQNFFGHGVTKNLCKALELYECEKAAHVKNDQQKDEFFTLARIRFSQAAEQNHADAQYELGIFYEHGRGGFTVDETQAATLYTKAADQGHADAEASLGRLFLIGVQIQQDVAKAVHFLQKAAAKPHTKAAKRVATMQYSGIGCTADKHKAHRFYVIAANTGDAEALNSLGLMFEEGDGCDLNFVKAAECYRSAAGLGSPHAHFNLGCLLSHGKGVARNVDAAQAHFRKAIELGYSLAQQFVLQDDAL
ncbi:hypothetical protein JM18_001979 [Phytophthora kernoviae]|uniref:Uncharacterized protein n=2 Tax=Phytophthora kernoviae TaxID=325452 RepID=A0A8T0M3Q5_9STRA|nr:hypothetical protein G195_004637 [Phytophthora kernoviae 00238/432]KAG2526757.1 hypothetical protein JM16_003724 [Phytophthora kernoviae]KAG2530716.1 hypothetical protein JM18_001979 [Phytophthora kernoviae]